MVVIRLLNGVALGMLLPVAQSLIPDISERSERGRLFGFQGATQQLGALGSHLRPHARAATPLAVAAGKYRWRARCAEGLCTHAHIQAAGAAGYLRLYTLAGAHLHHHVLSIHRYAKPQCCFSGWRVSNWNHLRERLGGWRRRQADWVEPLPRAALDSPDLRCSRNPARL